MVLTVIAGYIDRTIGYENEPILTETNALYSELFHDLWSDSRLSGIKAERIA